MQTSRFSLSFSRFYLFAFNEGGYITFETWHSRCGIATAAAAAWHFFCGIYTLLCRILNKNFYFSQVFQCS